MSSCLPRIDTAAVDSAKNLQASAVLCCIPRSRAVGVAVRFQHGPLLDGGTVFVPEFGTADADGRWIIEGYGVDPDIVVDQDPVEILKGHDPQLERGVQELMKLLPAVPTGLPRRLLPPIKTEAH